MKFVLKFDNSYYASTFENIVYMMSAILPTTFVDFGIFRLKHNHNCPVLQLF